MPSLSPCLRLFAPRSRLAAAAEGNTSRRRRLLLPSIFGPPCCTGVAAQLLQLVWLSTDEGDAAMAAAALGAAGALYDFGSPRRAEC